MSELDAAWEPRKNRVKITYTPCGHLNHSFDRTLCAEPCGVMHTYCRDCFMRLDPCAHDTALTDIKKVQAEREEAIRKDERQRIAERVIRMCENVHRDGDKLYVRVSDVVAAVRNEDTP